MSDVHYCVSMPFKITKYLAYITAKMYWDDTLYSYMYECKFDMLYFPVSFS